jgi:hypothetical protein
MVHEHLVPCCPTRTIPANSSHNIMDAHTEPLLETNKIRKLEEEFIPESLQRDYQKTFGHKKQYIQLLLAGRLRITG